MLRMSLSGKLHFNWPWREAFCGGLGTFHTKKEDGTNRTLD